MPDMILAFSGDSQARKEKPICEKEKASELQKSFNTRWCRVRASQGLKKPSQRHRHGGGSCFVRMNTRSARTYLVFYIQVISLIPSLIKIKKIKKKNTRTHTKDSSFVTKTQASERARENGKRFYFFSRTSSSSLLFLFISLSFCSPFSICKINDNLRSVVSVPELSPGNSFFISPRYLQTLGFCRGY